MRLDKLLAEAGFGTRQQVTRAIRAGRVTVDGQRARDGALAVDPKRVLVTFDGETIAWAAAYYLMVHKPAGTITSTVDREGPPVTGLVPDALQQRAWMPVGRLDADAEGLLLLTTHGELAHRLTHPRYEVPKTYVCTLAAPIHDDDPAAFALGVDIGEGPSLPAELESLGGARAKVVVREGKFHQVKRMFAARGNLVLHLQRVAFGPLVLGDLPRGEVRPLSAEEIVSLYAAVRLEIP